MSLDTSHILKRIQRWALNPVVVTSSIILGGFTGYSFPEIGKNVGFLGTLYVDLLKMIVLPFMLSAVIFSLRSIFAKSENMGTLLQKIVRWYLLALVMAAAIGTGSALLIEPGSGLDDATLKAFGNLIHSDQSTTTDLEITLAEKPVEIHHESLPGNIAERLIPSNIFSALSNGDTIKVLVFALLFGVAIGHIPAHLSNALTFSLETIYTACQKLTQWFNLLLPLASFAMAAEQLATTGLEPMRVMVTFVEVFLLAACLMMALSIFAIWRRSGQPLGAVLSSQQESFFMAISTRNSTACMPNMIESLVARLHFNKSEVELLIPLGVSILRIGPVVYYTVATLFIAQLYDRALTPNDILLVVGVSILAGIASTGMTSIVAVAQTSVVCTYLGLPFEAAFVLFVAVDPVADMLRTAMLVIGINGVTTLICSRPEEKRAAESTPDPALLGER
jgi:Na+/H+-dicarboxylate symporter